MLQMFLRYDITSYRTLRFLYSMQLNMILNVQIFVFRCSAAMNSMIFRLESFENYLFSSIVQQISSSVFYTG